MHDQPAKHFVPLPFVGKPELQGTVDRVAAQFLHNSIGDGCAAASQLEYEAFRYQNEGRRDTKQTKNYIDAVAAELERRQLLPIVKIAEAKLQQEERDFLQSPPNPVIAHLLERKMHDAGVETVENLANNLMVEPRDYANVLNQRKKNYLEPLEHKAPQGEQSNHVNEKAPAGISENKIPEQKSLIQQDANAEKIVGTAGVERINSKQKASHDTAENLKHKPGPENSNPLIEKSPEDANHATSKMKHDKDSDQRHLVIGGLAALSTATAVASGIGLYLWSRGKINPGTIAEVAEAADPELLSVAESPLTTGKAGISLAQLSSTTPAETNLGEAEKTVLNANSQQGKPLFTTVAEEQKTPVTTESTANTSEVKPSTTKEAQEAPDVIAANPVNIKTRAETPANQD